MDSDANSDITVFHTISRFDNSDLESPDKLANSEPSPSTISQPPFDPSTHKQKLTPPLSTISHISQVTPTYSPFTNKRSNNNSPNNTQISNQLNSMITLQQQIQHPHTLTVHQILSNLTSSNPPTPTPSSDYTPSLAQSSTSTQPSSTTNRVSRTFKRKFPNHPFTFKPRITRDYINYPDCTKTTEFLQISYPSSLKIHIITPTHTLNNPTMSMSMY